MYAVIFMLKRYNVWLETKDLKKLERIGKDKGGLKIAQMIRVAIRAYIRAEAKTK